MTNRVEKTYEGAPCKHGHGTTRYVSNARCIACSKESNKKSWRKDTKKNLQRVQKWRCENPEKIRMLKQKYYAENIELERERSRQWRTSNKTYKAEKAKEWYENNKEKVLDRRHHLYEQNKEQHYVASRKWKQANPEKARKYAREWNRRNPEINRRNRHARRARNANAFGFFTKTHLEIITKIQGGKCAYCREAENLHLDHVIPLSRGGSNWPWNLQWLCAQHNMRKGSKTDAEYRQLVGLPKAIPLSVSMFLLPLVF